MKVKELIIALCAFDRNAEVVAFGCEPDTLKNRYVDIIAPIRQTSWKEGTYKVLLYLSLKWRQHP